MKLLSRPLLIATSFTRGWRTHPLRTWAALFGVTMGVALTVLVVTISSSVSEAVRGAGGSQLVDLDIEVASRLPSGFNQATADRIRAAAGDAVAVPVVRINTRLIRGDDPVLSVIGVPAGARHLVPSFNPNDLERAPAKRGTGALLLGKNWAADHAVALGDVVDLQGPKGPVPWTITALVPGTLPNNGAIAVTNINQARAAFERSDNTDAIYVRTPQGTSQGDLEARLRKAAAGAAVVGDPGISSSADEASLLAIRGILIAVALLGVAAGAVVVFVSWRLMLEDERRNISRFLLSGATVTDLALGSGMVIIVACLGCAVAGVALGALASNAVRGVTQQLADFTGLAAAPDSNISAVPLLAGFAAAFAISGIAWAFSLRAIRKVPIIDAFRAERPDLSDHPRFQRLVLIPIAVAVFAMLAASRGSSSEWAPAAVGLIVLSACVLAFCIPVGLALLVQRAEGFHPLAIGRYLTANSRRVALLTTTFGVGIAVSVVLSGLILSFSQGLSHSVDSWTKAEMFVRPGWAGTTTRDARFPGSLQARLAAIPGVERAGAWTSTMVEESGHQFLLQAWDTKNTKNVVELIVYEGARGQSLWAALDRGEIAISQNMANLRDLGVGDDLQVPTASGTKTFRVAAVVDDYLSERGAAIMSLSTYRRITGDSRVESIQLALEPGASEAAIAKRVRLLLPNWPGLVVASREEMRQRVTGFFDSLVSVLGGLTVAIFALVLLVAVTTTAALLNARAKFLGLSSICGATSDSIRRQLLVEAFLIGGGAWLAGAPAGFLAIKPTIATLSIVTGLEPNVVAPVGTLALSAPLVLLASAAAVMIPARRLLPELLTTLRFE